MDRTAMFLLLCYISMTAIHKATAVCPWIKSPQSRLQRAAGSFGYTDSNRQPSNWCGWIIPNKNLTDHVILLKLTSISLRPGNKCLGELSLTGFTLFCRKTLNTCFIYASRSFLNFIMTSDLIKSENCTNMYWHYENRNIERRIRYRTKEKQQRGTRTFTFDYKYIPYEQDRNPMTSTTNMITSVAVTTEDDIVTTRNETIQSISLRQPAGVSPSTLIGVVAFFLLLVSACCILLVLLYRRLRKLKLQSESPRVEYKLSKPRDITILQLSETGETSVSPGRDSNFHLHGNHNISLSQNDVTIDQEPVERNYYSVDDFGSGVELAGTNHTLPLGPRQRASAEETCVYATVNKQRAQTDT